MSTILEWVIFLTKVCIIFSGIYFVLKYLGKVIMSYAKNVGSERRALEAKFSHYNDLELLEVLSSCDKENYIMTIAALNVATPRLTNNLQLKSAVEVLQESPVDIIRSKARMIIEEL